MSWNDDEFTKKRKEWEEKQKKLDLERKQQREEAELKKAKRKLEEKKKAERAAKREERQQAANEEMERLMGAAFSGGVSQEESKDTCSLSMGTLFGFNGGGVGGGSSQRSARGTAGRNVPAGANIPGLEKARSEKDKSQRFVNMSGGGTRFSNNSSGKAVAGNSGSLGTGNTGGAGIPSLKRF
jgi:hypothetical protein